MRPGGAAEPAISKIASEKISGGIIHIREVVGGWFVEILLFPLCFFDSWELPFR